jgi:hypothetical protein
MLGLRKEEPGAGTSHIPALAAQGHLGRAIISVMPSPLQACSSHYVPRTKIKEWSEPMRWRSMPCIFRGIIRQVLWSASIFVFVVGSSGAIAQVGVYFNFSQWERLTENQRIAYIAGAFDSLISNAATNEERRDGLHYQRCIRNAAMSSEQLGANVLAFVQTQPALHGQTVQLALVRYLVALCGPP